jgi:hypothetical protein
MKLVKTLAIMAIFTAAEPASAESDKPSPQRLKATVEKLVSFGTRHTLSSATDPKRGIGAARAWAKSEFEGISKSCNACLKIETLEKQMSGPRAPGGVNIVDLLAIKPGKMGWGHVIIISAHIDSRVTDIMNATSDAPGANDDGSGSALVIEAARLIAKMPQSNATIVFALLSGEEQGLMGGKLLAETANTRGWNVSAMLNNDIVGNSVGTDGRVVDDTVRIFSEGIRASETLDQQMARRNSGGEDDGPSRALMRSVVAINSFSTGKKLKIFGVRRPDRFGRGGDHLPALELGFPAIRFTVGVENYNNQHQDLRTEKGVRYGDTVDKMDFVYLAKVTALNVAVANKLADAVPAPESASLSGAVSSDTKISWTKVPGASGYRIYYRRADESIWRHLAAAMGGDKSEITVPGVIVDDHFFGVASMSGPTLSESIITFAGLPPKQ